MNLLFKKKKYLQLWETMYTTILLTVRIYCKEYTLICFTLFLITMCYMYLQGYQALFTNTLIYIISRNLQMAIGHQNLMFVDYVGSASGLDLQIFRPFHKTLPKSSAFINIYKQDFGKVLWNRLYIIFKTRSSKGTVPLLWPRDPETT